MQFADALRLVPGFSVSRTGASGGLTQVRVRGAEGNQVLVVIDGVEANGMHARCQHQVKVVTMREAESGGSHVRGI